MRNPLSANFNIPAERPVPGPAVRSEADKEAGTETKTVQDHDDATDSDEAISKDAQLGVQKIEATTKVWSKQHLIMAYVL